MFAFGLSTTKTAPRPSFSYPSIYTDVEQTAQPYPVTEGEARILRSERVPQALKAKHESQNYRTKIPGRLTAIRHAFSPLYRSTTSHVEATEFATHAQYS